MNTYTVLFIECLMSMALSLVVLYVLSVPLVNVLGRICPDEQAASFWAIYTKVVLVILPLLFVLMVDFLTHFRDPADSLRLGLIAVLSALLIGLYSMGKRLGQFVVAPQQRGGRT